LWNKKEYGNAILEILEALEVARKCNKYVSRLVLGGSPLKQLVDFAAGSRLFAESARRAD
jgi:hypothetical protein